jgi:hypothetical protein
MKERSEHKQKNTTKENAMKKHGLTLCVVAGLILALAVQAQATVLDFGDNAASAPGFYGYLYYNNYWANKLTDHKGNSVADLDLSYNVGTIKPFYYFKLWNHTLAVSAALPFGSVNARNSFGSRESSSGIGDFVLAPGIFLYENADTGTYISFWENISAPTGNWSGNRALRGGPNLGLHYWFLQHQLAFSQTLFKGKISYDMNISYYQRFEEPTLDLRAGDSVEVEGILGYGITDKLRAGIYADFWTDVRDTRMNGANIDNSKRLFFAIGPALNYSTGKWSFNVRFVPDVVSENGPKGYLTWLRVVYSF